MSRIWAQEIEMSFHGNTVLNKISLDIQPGEIFGLLGPSGAGKTTLIKILTGQLKQTGGSAKIFESDNEKITGDDFRKIGMVLDNTGLYERLSCYDNLALFARIYEMPLADIHTVLCRVGLEEAEKKSVSNLSKGMKQRLVLARAIMHKPQILFLDEPTSGLDPVNAVSIRKLIQEEKERGATIFLTTHNMEEATKLCDNVALLNQGRIVEYGEPLDICRRYNHQNKLLVLTKSGEQIELFNNETAIAVLTGYLKDNAIESIHSTEPNLETVFMELTGRGLETDE
ncbi:ABC transporter ATP-binding protein [Konateibacter massiliensis]|uniref:ABC transporter ATP-binding protein n=1 Tax=Konateibacter massiliensis TaxID=2002841 RepID=UPI000C158970|nr:ABC transporter ATP-binding protein [Konateibacter massiliensis]